MLTNQASPSTHELHVAACFLRQSCMLANAVRDLLAGRDADRAARLNDVVVRLDREREQVEAMLDRRLVN